MEQMFTWPEDATRFWFTLSSRPMTESVKLRLRFKYRTVTWCNSGAEYWELVFGIAERAIWRVFRARTKLMDRMRLRTVYLSMQYE